jgi:hypothetical protein
MDAVDSIVQQWRTVRTDLDVSPIEVIGRVSRLSRLVDRRLAVNFARHGIEAWMYDVMATLRRSGEPYELTAGNLVRQTMVTTGAITNRIDRLEARGFVERARAVTAASHRPAHECGLRQGRRGGPGTPGRRAGTAQCPLSTAAARIGITSAQGTHQPR